jgi:hypothetical protein
VRSVARAGGRILSRGRLRGIIIRHAVAQRRRIGTACSIGLVISTTLRTGRGDTPSMPVGNSALPACPPQAMSPVRMEEPLDSFVMIGLTSRRPICQTHGPSP